MHMKYLPALTLISLIAASLLFFSCSETEEPLIGIGTPIPGFTANDDTGNVWNLADHLDNDYLIVYFYPAAMTGGCTLQACSYRDNSEAIKELGGSVVGISGDSVNNIKIFRDAHDLNFTLLSDANGEIAGMFGVPLKEGGVFTSSINGEDISLERSYTTARWTFILDKDGKIIYKDTGVKAKNDSDSVIEFLSAQ